MSEVGISESLREVWRWKEEVGQNFAGLSDEELIRAFTETAERVLHEHGIVLPTARPSQKRGVTHRG